MASFLANFEQNVSTFFYNSITTPGQTLLTTFRPAFVAGFGLWVLLIAYEVAYGASDDGVNHAVKKIFRIFVIGTLALYGWPDVVELIDQLRLGFVGSLGNVQPTQGSPVISLVLEQQILTPLTAQFYEVMDSIAQTISEQSITKPITLLWTLCQCVAVFLTFGVLAACAGLLAVVTLVMYMVAYSAFCLLAAVGPFFLLCMAFPFLQRFMESWVGSMMTAILAMAFTALLAVATSNLLGLTTPAGSTRLDVTDGSVITDMLGKGFTALLLIYLYYKVFDLAAALGGGMNIGNNLASGARNLMNDMRRGGSGSNGANGRNANTIQNGNGGGGGGGGGGGRQSTAERATQRNRTLVGAAISSIADGTKSGVSSIGRFAYNRVRRSR